MPLSVVIPVFAGVQLIDFVGPMDVFDAANRLTGTVLYEPTVTAVRGEPVRSGAGLSFETTGIDELRHETIDLLLVPGSLDVSAMLADKAHLSAVADLATRSTTVSAVCTGAFLLGELGWLDGRRVTTHWAFARRLSDRFPDSHVTADSLFEQDGNVLTCGGAASGMDLALNIVEMHHGRELAREVAKWLVIYLQRPGSQSQFGVQSLIQSDVQPSMRSRLTQSSPHPMSTTQSPSSLARSVSAAATSLGCSGDVTGETPAKFVEATRLDPARALLESTDASHDSIARQCGFSSPELLPPGFSPSIRCEPVSTPNDVRKRARGYATLTSELSPTVDASG